MNILYLACHYLKVEMPLQFGDIPVSQFLWKARET